MEFINTDALTEFVTRLAKDAFEAKEAAFRAQWQAEQRDRLLTKKEAAQRLAISPSTLDTRRREGKIEGLDDGTVKYRESEVLRYIENLKKIKDA
jgi:predicted DNA-binding transcriptional regulator AlpA